MERRDLPPEVQGPSGRFTTYGVRLPHQRLPDARLVLETQARVFARPLVLRDW
jgi:hypothetical protein